MGMLATVFARPGAALSAVFVVRTDWGGRGMKTAAAVVEGSARIREEFKTSRLTCDRCKRRRQFHGVRMMDSVAQEAQQMKTLTIAPALALPYLFAMLPLTVVVLFRQ